MKLGFIGNGGMGQAMQKAATDRGHDIAAVVDANDEFDLKDSEVVLEATLPSACLENVKKLCDAKKDFVIVTTGWYDNLDQVKQMVEDAGVRCLWSSNFSIGVNLYFRVVEAAAKLFNSADEFDVWATEIHHKNKVDSPSGTAKTLEEILLANIARKTEVVEDKLDRKIEDNEIHFSSTRGGVSNFGHTVCFDAEADFVKIEHFARNRNGYALGAVKVAEWLTTQNSGLYSMEDYLKQLTNRSTDQRRNI